MPLQIPILYQDDDLVAINKPAGIPSQAAYPDPQPGDIVSLLAMQLGQTYLGQHQRLDKETSGVMIFARRPEANAALAAAFAGNAVHKEYVAIVHGRPGTKRGTLRAGTAPDGHGNYRVSDPHSDRKAKQAITHWQVEESSPDGLYSRVRLRLETGRTHQARIHLAYLGCPVAGDPIYDPQHRPAPVMLLHAERLSLSHPTTGKPLVVTALPAPIFERVAVGLPELKLASVLMSSSRGAKPSASLPRYTDMAAGIEGLVVLALQRRQPLRSDPNTTAYRLLNGEADGFPGLTVDIYDNIGVISLYADNRTWLLEDFVQVLRRHIAVQSWYVKRRPRSASGLSVGSAEVGSPSQPLLGPSVVELVIAEEGLNYVIRPGQGLSTGLFLDMREMRLRVRYWAAHKTVLNCFAYTCGFGTAASAGGAQRVLNLDAGQPALQWGKRNYAENGLPVSDQDFIYGDVFDWLRRLARRKQVFDIVILDPPSYSTTRDSRFSAERDYATLAALAAGVVANGGLLIACTNHARLSRSAFRSQVEAGLLAAKRPASAVGAYRAPALDFPAPFRGDSYLKIAVYRLASS